MDEDKGTREFSPFGNPDGSRADLDDILQNFVTFGGSSLWGGLATRNDDLTARVIVGRKGSGKTVYLRRLQAYVSNQESLFADDIQQSLPTTENIIKYCQFFEEKILTEKWMLIWHRAIMRSIVSHLLNNPKLLKSINKTKIEEILQDYASLIRRFGTPLSVYSQVSEIIQSYDTKHQISKYLDNPLWQELEYLIGDILQSCPPLCFFLDAVDEEFAHAPMYWHRCQKGLFYQTMRLLRDSRLGGRLHIVICIRDIVLSSVYRSEHRTRYIEEPHIRILNWNRESIKYFLECKIKLLDPKYFRGDISKGINIEEWLGISIIHNMVRNIDENIMDYLLRHTRLLPRDIVLLGNKLCKSLENNKGQSIDKEEIIRNIVAEVSRIIGDEQLTICGNQISSNTIPKNAALKEYSEIYTDVQEYVRGLTDSLKVIVKHIGKERFSYGELISCKEFTKTYFDESIDVFSILWQNGLLGYIQNMNGIDKIFFYSISSIEEFNIPLEKEIYVFHSCLIDAVGLQPIGNKPVVI